MAITATFTQLLADDDGWGHMRGWGGGGMWLWGTLMTVACVAIIAAVVLFVIRARDRTGSTGGSRARAILDERYARGELTSDEYREHLDHLA